MEIVMVQCPGMSAGTERFSCDAEITVDLMHWRFPWVCSRWRKRQPVKLGCIQWRVCLTARSDDWWRLNGGPSTRNVGDVCERSPSPTRYRRALYREEQRRLAGSIIHCVLLRKQTFISSAGSRCWAHDNIACIAYHLLHLSFFVCFTCMLYLYNVCFLCCIFIRNK